MTKSFKSLRRKRSIGALLAGSVILQLGGCQFGEISTSVTLSAQELLIGLIRSAILQPIDQFVTDAINEAFDEDK